MATTSTDNQPTRTLTSKLTKRAPVAALVGLLTAGILAMSSNTAQAAAVCAGKDVGASQGSVLNITNSSGLQLNVDNWRTDNGAGVYPYASGAPTANSDWVVDRVGIDAHTHEQLYALKNVNSGDCLETNVQTPTSSSAFNASRSWTDQWSCNGGYNQYWYLRWDPSGQYIVFVAAVIQTIATGWLLSPKVGPLIANQLTYQVNIAHALATGTGLTDAVAGLPSSGVGFAVKYQNAGSTSWQNARGC